MSSGQTDKMQIELAFRVFHYSFKIIGLWEVFYMKGIIKGPINYKFANTCIVSSHFVPN